MYRNYYSINDMPSLPQKPPPEKQITAASAKPRETQTNKPTGIFGGFSSDDIILLAVVFILLSNECNDKILLAAIAFIFICDSI